MKATLFLLLPLAAIAAEPKLREHHVNVTSPRHEFTVAMGGTMDGDNTRSPVGYQAWSRAFEPMREVRIANCGDTPVTNPWIVVNERRDWRTVQKIITEATRGCTNERERAIAIWRFVIDNRFHATPNDGDNIDPVKQFNVYGYSLCGDIAQTIRQLWKVAGFKTRRGWPHGHCLTEVWFDDGWRMLDGDESIICLDRDNKTIVGEEQIVRDHDLMKRTHTYGILQGEDPLTDQFSVSLHVYEGKREGDYRDTFGHQMALTLRPGEALVWRWDNSGRYHGSNLATGWGPRAQEPLANGRLVYAPPRMEAVGERVGSALVVPVASPYVIVGGKMEWRGEAKGFISFDQQKWTLLRENSDLNELFPSEGRPRYRYWLKFEPATAVQSLKVESTLQMAPLSLPALRLGGNRVVYTDESSGTRNVRLSFGWAERDDVQPPAAPEVEFPKDKGEVEGTQFTFKWNAKGHDYHFQLADREDMRWPLSSTFDRLVSRTPQDGTTSWTIPWRGLLNPDQRYFWRVRTRNKAGLWGPWSRTFSFTSRGPGVPLQVRCEAGVLRWNDNPKGRPAVKWRVYGSDEKGFTTTDSPHKIIWESGYERPREMRQLPPTLLGETDKPQWRSLTNAFYRVVAVDAQGIMSGASDYATAPRPRFLSQPTMSARVGEKYSYMPRVIRSLGDLRCKKYTKDKIYWAGYWNIEKSIWSLTEAPAWLKLNTENEELSGTPPTEAAGSESKVTVHCEISGVGVDSQSFTLRVAK